MTAQISDALVYCGEMYSLVGCNGTGLFEPTEHGMRPDGMSSCCWRGYVCDYNVAEGRLLLEGLAVYLTEPPPVLFGCEPRPTERNIIFNTEYEDLGWQVPFSGGLLLGRDFIPELYVHMGFHPAWKYRVVHELTFHSGQLVQEDDRSSHVAEFKVVWVVKTKSGLV